MKNILMIIAFLLILSCFTQAQVLDGGSEKKVYLADSLEVRLFAGYHPSSQHQYYYLPVNYRITLIGGRPSFSYLAFREEENEPLKGAIMNMVLEWGLDKFQQMELDKLIREEIDSLGVLMGAVLIQPVLPPTHKIKIEGKGEIADIIRDHLVSAAGLASFPASKQAVSFRFDAESAQQLDEALKQSEKFPHISLVSSFSYELISQDGWSGHKSQETGQLSLDLSKWMLSISNEEK